MSSPPAPGRNSALTFGVEIELCVATLAADCEDPHPSDTRAVHGLDTHFEHPAVPSPYPEPDAGYNQTRYDQIWFLQLRIAEVLNKAGFPAITETEIDRVRGAPYPEEERLARWIITDDISLNHPRTDLKYSWYNIEINSPAYYFQPAAVDAVKKVCTLMKNSFRIHINRSMGVHVHVGDAKNHLKLDVLRSLMATLFVFEPQLNTLHPKHRIEGTYCQGLNTTSQLGRKQWADEPFKKSRRQLLEELLAMEDRHDVLIGMSSGGVSKLAYNLTNMAAGFNFEVGKNTIEFRQHESTLDEERIAAWIELCVALVEFPLRESKENLEALLREHVNDTVEEFDVIKTLLALNLSASADFYDARFHALWVKAGRTLPVPASEGSDSEGSSSDGRWVSEAYSRNNE